MGIFSKQKSPKPQPVVPLPDDNDPAVIRAKRMSILSAQARGGRDSTILAGGGGSGGNGSDTLGSSPGGMQ